jgi:tetratricopeptide (TPR) repeat protein
MSAAEDYQAARARLRRIVAQGGRRISLVEFTTLPQLREIIDELHAEAPGRPFAEVEYDPLHTTAPEVVRDAQQALENKPADPLPLLVLRPRELRATPEDERAAYDFWQAMNFRRELLGQLPAQILLCVDPWHHRWLVDRAADLWSWLMPKLHLIPPPDLSAPRQESLAALSSFTEFPVSPEVAEKQWQNYWPLLEKKAASHTLLPGDFRRLVFPLFEGALAMGNLVRARKIRDAACDTKPSVEDEIEWHKLNAQLGCGAGDFSPAEEHALKLLAIAKNHSDRRIRFKAGEALTRLAILFGIFGQSDAAEHLHKECISVAQELFGPEHQATLASRSNLASELHAQGKHVEAEKEHRAVLVISERVLGTEHRDTLTSRNNLAVALADQGKYAEAEKEFHAVLALRERVLGAEHPATLISRHNLANALNAQGKHTEAEKEHRAVLAIMERVRGAEHPVTLTNRYNLANALNAQGKHAEAEKEHRVVLALRERVLGAEHPDTLSSRHNLANALQVQGKHAEAEKEHRAVLAIRERVLGAEHPDVFLSCYNLALCLEKQGRLEEALAFAKRAGEGWKRVLGEEHPNCKSAVEARQRIEAKLKGK